MKARIHGLVAGGALALYAAMGAAAYAQPMQGQSMQGPGRHVMRMQADSPAERAARLRDLLQLRPAQDGALQAYVKAIDAAHAGMMGPHGPDGMPKTTPERLARMQQMMAQHQAAMSAMMDATRRFYDQLDAGQKRAFDAVPMTMMMHHRMGMGGDMKPGMDHRHMAPPPAAPPAAPPR